MVSRSTWLHLRIPFSYFLLPVFLFALAVCPGYSPKDLVSSFLIIHLLLYPASNGYNSYFDKDEKSIGGLENPPPVSKELYWTSLAMDAIAIVAGFLLINVLFAEFLLIYGCVSKMYSHPSIRLKKYPVTGWLITGLFQGLFTFMMCLAGIGNLSLTDLLNPFYVVSGILTSIMLWGNYPMTQVYQHEEDALHGDRTMSILLGIRGTFLFVQVVFTLAAVGFVLYFLRYYSETYGIAFLVALLPVVSYFLFWFIKVWRDKSNADYKSTMRLNLISATCLNAFFLFLYLHPFS